MDEDGEFSLRNTAATGIGEISVEEVAGDERTRGGNKDAPPRSASRWIHAGGESSGQKYESHYDESDECSDYKAEENGDAVFTSGKATGPRTSFVDNFRSSHEVLHSGYETVVSGARPRVLGGAKRMRDSKSILNTGVAIRFDANGVLAWHTGRMHVAELMNCRQPRNGRAWRKQIWTN